MTHGGLLGSSEAAYCGVPTVSTPFYGDQFLNSAAMEERGMGVVLRYQDINKEAIFLALRKALDQKTKESAKQVSYSYRNRPMTPKESVVFWSEYVINTKGKLLRPHSGDAHYFVYTMLDIHLFLLFVVIAIFSSWIYLVKKFILKSNRAKDKVDKLTTHRGASVEKKFK